MNPNDVTNNSDPPDLPSFRPPHNTWLAVVVLLYSAAAVALVAWTDNKWVFTVTTWITIVFGPGGFYACRTPSNVPAFIKLFFTDGRHTARYVFPNVYALMLFGLILYILQKSGII